MRQDSDKQRTTIWRYFLEPDVKASDSNSTGKVTAVFLFCTILFLLLILGFNVVVDPYDMYPSGVLNPMVWSDRRQKIQLFEEYEHDKEIVVLGSSRMMRINPSLIDSLTGLHSFNLAVNHARTEDYLALLRYAVLSGKTDSVKCLIIGLDVHAFRGYYAMDNLLKYYPELFSYLESEGKADWKRSLEVFWIKLTKGVSLHQTEMSGKSVVRFLNSGHWDNAYSFAADGGMLFNRSEDDEGGLKPEVVNRKIESAVKNAKNEFQGFGGFSKARIDYFKDLVAFCKARKIKLICVVMPYQPKFLERLEGTAFEEINSRWMLLINELALEQDFTLLNASDPGIISFDPSEFYDDVHMTGKNTEKLARFIIGSSASGGSDTF